MAIPARSDGQTIDETWFNILKEEIESLSDSFLLSLDGLAINFEVPGVGYSAESSYQGFMYYRVTQDLTVLSATLFNLFAGSAGSTQVDIKRWRSGGSFTSIFTTKPSIPYTAGNNATSDTGTGATAALLDSTMDELLAGDILRFDITAVQTDGSGMILSLNVEPTGV